MRRNVGRRQLDAKREIGRKGEAGEGKAVGSGSHDGDCGVAVGGGYNRGGAMVR